jgi:hypothetical protein
VSSVCVGLGQSAEFTLSDDDSSFVLALANDVNARNVDLSVKIKLETPEPSSILHPRAALMSRNANCRTVVHCAILCPPNQPLPSEALWTVKEQARQ